MSNAAVKLPEIEKEIEKLRAQLHQQHDFAGEPAMRISVQLDRLILKVTCYDQGTRK